MKKCKYCQSEIDDKAKVCPKCGKKQGMPKWLIVVIVILVIAIIGGLSGEESDSRDKSSTTKNKVTITDFSTMTQADIDTWCSDNKVNCKIEEEYSDTVAKGGFISQSVDADKSVYENDTIIIKFSLGKQPTTEQKNALAKAQSYSDTMHMSKQGIYDQLTSEYGEQFPADAAQYAIDNVKADWKANALAKAKSYQETMNMSKKAIYDQLISKYGEQFTAEEAQYAIDNLD